MNHNRDKITKILLSKKFFPKILFEKPESTALSANGVDWIN